MVFFFVDMLVQVLSIAAQEVGGDTFKASLADRRWRLNIWKMAAKDGALHAKEQQVTLQRGEVLDRKREVEFEPVIEGGCPQGRSVVVNIK